MKTLRGLQRTAGLLAAHDAGDAARNRVVGDDDGLAVQHIGLAVQRQHLFAWSLAMRACRLPESLSASNTCSGRPRSWAIRLVASTRAEIGFHAHRFQTVLHPLRRRAVLHIADQPAREDRAGVFVLRREIERDFLRAGEFARHRLDLPGLERAQPRRRQIARDAIDAGRVAAIGRDRDIDHRIGQAPAPARRARRPPASAASSMMPS